MEAYHRTVKGSASMTWEDADAIVTDMRALGLDPGDLANTGWRKGLKRQSPESSPKPDVEPVAAPERLLRHTTLVGEAAELLIEELAKVGLEVDAHFVRLGGCRSRCTENRAPDRAVGGRQQTRTRWPSASPPSGRRRVGGQMLPQARWMDMEVSFEELLVAAADTLWRGKRNPTLEQWVIEGAAERARKTTWDVFVPLDTTFERIAEAGAERLERSR